MRNLVLLRVLSKQKDGSEEFDQVDYSVLTLSFLESDKELPYDSLLPPRFEQGLEAFEGFLFGNDPVLGMGPYLLNIIVSFSLTSAMSEKKCS
jgi:hypothetical protein